MDGRGHGWRLKAMVLMGLGWHDEHASRDNLGGRAGVQVGSRERAQLAMDVAPRWARVALHPGPGRLVLLGASFPKSAALTELCTASMRVLPLIELGWVMLGQRVSFSSGMWALFSSFFMFLLILPIRLCCIS